MEVILILGVAVVGYLLLQRNAAPATSVSGSAAVATTINQQSKNAALQLQGINMTEAQPDTGLAVASVGVSAGTSIGSSLAQAGSSVATAIPIVGAVLGVGLSILGQHTARVKGATAENSGINAIVPAFDADLKEINQAWRAGQINATMAVTYLQTVHDNYWSYMSQFVGRPGVATKSCPGGQVGGPLGKGGCTSGQPTCDKTCTAGCCVGCSAINGSLANAIWAIQTGYHQPVAVCAVFGSKFGANDRAGYQLSW